jgi:hypothetical protein
MWVQETGMSETGKPDKEESFEERVSRFERQKVRPESEERKSPDGPGSQISPDVEPAGS